MLSPFPWDKWDERFGEPSSTHAEFNNDSLNRLLEALLSPSAPAKYPSPTSCPSNTQTATTPTVHEQQDTAAPYDSLAQTWSSALTPPLSDTGRDQAAIESSTIEPCQRWASQSATRAVACTECHRRKKKCSRTSSEIICHACRRRGKTCQRPPIPPTSTSRKPKRPDPEETCPTLSNTIPQANTSLPSPLLPAQSTGEESACPQGREGPHDVHWGRDQRVSVPQDGDVWQRFHSALQTTFINLLELYAINQAFEAEVIHVINKGLQFLRFKIAELSCASRSAEPSRMAENLFLVMDAVKRSFLLLQMLKRKLIITPNADATIKRVESIISFMFWYIMKRKRTSSQLANQQDSTSEAQPAIQRVSTSEAQPASLQHSTSEAQLARPISNRDQFPHGTPPVATSTAPPFSTGLQAQDASPESHVSTHTEHQHIFVNRGPHSTNLKTCDAIEKRDVNSHVQKFVALRQRVRCRFCIKEKTFSRRDGLLRHIRKVHAAKDKGTLRPI